MKFAAAIVLLRALSIHCYFSLAKMIRARSQKQKGVAAVIILSLQKKGQKQKRRWWVQNWVEQKTILGVYNTPSGGQ